MPIVEHGENGVAGDVPQLANLDATQVAGPQTQKPGKDESYEMADGTMLRLASGDRLVAPNGWLSILGPTGSTRRGPSARSVRSDRSWRETTRPTKSTPQGTSKYTSAVFLEDIGQPVEPGFARRQLPRPLQRRLEAVSSRSTTASADGLA